MCKVFLFFYVINDWKQLPEAPQVKNINYTALQEHRIGGKKQQAHATEVIQVLLRSSCMLRISSEKARGGWRFTFKSQTSIITKTKVTPIMPLQNKHFKARLSISLPSFSHLPARCISTPIAEPLLAGVAVNHTGRVMDTTVTGIKMRRGSDWEIAYKKTQIQDLIYLAACKVRRNESQETQELVEVPNMS